MKFVTAATSPLTTVELFAGIGGFRIAADLHTVRTIWANDIDPWACRAYAWNFGPEVLHKGDVRRLFNAIPPHDLLTAGFPCQPFSSAGKKKGIRDPRGTLFQVVAAIISKHKPTYFVLENVKRLLFMESGAHFATILDALANLDYLVEWRLLNAMHFSLAQNRQRVVIVGTYLRRVDQQDARRPIVLASEKDLRTLGPAQRAKLVDATRWTHIQDHTARFPTWGLALDSRFFGATLADFSARGRPVTLANVLERSPEPRFDFTESTRARISESKLVHKWVDGVEIISNQQGGARMGYTVFGISGVAPTLTATTSRHYERYQIGDRYRRLTNIEYARLQGFPDRHCEELPLSQQYRLLGNAVPPPLAYWVIDQLIRDSAVPTTADSLEQQLSMFTAV